MQNCLDVNESYVEELRMIEKSWERLHKFTNKIDYIRESLKNISFIDPKVIDRIYDYNKRDLKSRESEANRIAREFKSGKNDPTKGNIIHH